MSLDHAGRDLTPSLATLRPELPHQRNGLLDEVGRWVDAWPLIERHVAENLKREAHLCVVDELDRIGRRLRIGFGDDRGGLTRKTIHVCPSQPALLGRHGVSLPDGLPGTSGAVPGPSVRPRTPSLRTNRHTMTRWAGDGSSRWPKSS